MVFVYGEREQLIKEIRKMLIDTGTTQKELADRLGLMPQGLTNLLNKKNLSFDDVKRIADALGYVVSVEFVARGV